MKLLYSQTPQDSGPVFHSTSRPSLARTGQGRLGAARLLMAGMFCALTLALVNPAEAANLPAEWQLTQQFEVATPGLVKLSLPLETLDASRPGLEDLRLHDDVGNEIPYWIQIPASAPKVIRRAKSFQSSLNTSTTVITLETGLAQPLDGLTLESPSIAFVKSVKVEFSPDGRSWRSLAEGLPIFRQPNGASHLQILIPEGMRPWLRLTVDDQRSQPIPFTGVVVHASAGEPGPTELLPITLAERQENPGETRLTLNLGGANVRLAAIEIETPEPLFTRHVSLAIPEVLDDSIRERTLARGSIYRVAIEGQPAVENLSVTLETQVRSRELRVLIDNQNSPPLSITAVRAVRRPVYIVFFARVQGVHHLLTSNPRCAPPRYDIAALGSNLNNTSLSSIRLSPVVTNPNFSAPEVLPGVRSEGSPLDVSGWRFRKAIKLARPGAQQIELDLDVLAHAQTDFQDLRLLKEGKQSPYILERTSINRRLTPTVSATRDAKNPKLSRWIIKLSHPALPITRLSCLSRTPLFQRELTLYEEPADGRGEKYRRTAGSASWVQTPGNQSKELFITCGSRLETDTLFLETHDGDNPAIELEKFEILYLATRVLFKTSPVDNLVLYYGNALVAPPRYDLSLVAGQLLGADKSPASLATEESLKKSLWGEGRTAGKGGVVFWGILAVVVIALLVIISRLLPASTPPAA